MLKSLLLIPAGCSSIPEDPVECGNTLMKFLERWDGLSEQEASQWLGPVAIGQWREGKWGGLL